MCVSSGRFRMVPPLRGGHLGPPLVKGCEARVSERHRPRSRVAGALPSHAGGPRACEGQKPRHLLPDGGAPEECTR